MPSIRQLDRTLGLFCPQWIMSRRRRDPRRIALLVVISMVAAYYLYQTVTMPVRFLFINENVNQECIIPDLDPFDKSIMQYVWTPDPIRCDPSPDLVYVTDTGYVQFNHSAFKYYGETKYKCSYSVLTRNPPDDDYHVKLADEVFFEPPIRISSDFFRVRCYKKKNNQKVFDSLLESVFVTDEAAQQKAPETGNQYSVFMFGIDSTSRLSAIRKLPKTYDYLTRTLGAHVFKGYMKQGDNTFPNLVPILTGKQPWTADLPNEEGTKYDITNFPFIWKNFSHHNYATFYAEDYPIIATFNTEASGFRQPPTDHYMRPWMLGLSQIGFATEVLKHVLLPFEYSNINVKKTSSLCYGNKPVHKHLINYYKRFVTMYKHKLRFAFSWLVQICHEFVNFLELGDNDFYEFLKFLKEDGHLDNAFLIFFSDHGSRIDDIRNTFVGRIEERMPLLSVIPPTSFAEKFPDAARNLHDNTERLTSNLDFHEMLDDIVLGNFDSSFKFKTYKRGTSLFQPISDTRSCAQASIPEHFCACYGSTKMAPDDPVSLQVAHFAVKHLNLLLHKYSDICAKLSLFKIHDIELISLGLSARGEEESRWTVYKFFSKPEANKHKRFLVIFETLPGNAMFEATVDYHVDAGMEIKDDVSRTNKYGNTSKCVPEKKLHRYCYCKSFIH